MATVRRSVRLSGISASPRACSLTRLRSLCPRSQLRSYASPSRRQVTVTSDDGRVRWADLSVREKAARTTQQSVNLIVVLGGILATAGVIAILYTDILSPESRTNQFSRAFERIRRDPQCQELLGGPMSAITAYGDSSKHGSGGWRANRHAQQTVVETDKLGTEHMYMSFKVVGSQNPGTAHVHLTKSPGATEWDTRQLYLDVTGHQRVWLENADSKADRKGPTKLFGVRWW